MAIRIVRLGSARSADEGLRIGTVRRPPRGVPKSEFASQNWYDIWFPNLAPSVETMKLGQGAETPSQWTAFSRKYRAEMAAPENARTIELLARLSQQTDFSVGCYCENEAHCHRSVLRTLLLEKGAKFALIIWGLFAISLFADAAPPAKKLIEYGWDVPTPAQMRDELASMEKRPFDGLIFRLSAGHNAFVTKPLDPAKFAEDEKILRALQFTRFHDNFVLVWGSPPADFDWFNDTQWDAI